MPDEAELKEIFTQLDKDDVVVLGALEGYAFDAGQP